LGSEWLPALSRNKICLKGAKISEYWERPKNMSIALKAIPQQEFQKCFQQWQHRWAKFITSEGEYLEGDPSQQALSVQVCFAIKSFRELRIS
jgi:hypothetical protein